LARATTAPKVRATSQASAEPVPVPAHRFGMTEQTVYKWRHRDSVHARTRTRTGCASRRGGKRFGGSFPRRRLISAWEAVAEVLRKALLVSLNDLMRPPSGLT